MLSNYEAYRKLIEDNLTNYITNMPKEAHTISSAMEYSLSAGGKRLRPVLLLAAYDFSGGNIEDALPYALAIEYIHTYSLIHDDLPAMDDDDLRRGKPTNHKVFGEAMAILAGDALLNTAVEIMLNDIVSHPNNGTENRIRAMDVICESSGIRGMIGGQVLDIESEGKTISEETLNYIHINKTAALIRASVLAGLYLGKADEETIQSFDFYGLNLGLAFQIADDILDIKGTKESLGKTPGSDEYKNKNTYVSIHGLEKAEEELNRITNQAIDSINKYGEDAEFFTNLAKELVTRRG